MKRAAPRRAVARKPNARRRGRPDPERGPYAVLYREAHAEGPGGWVEVGRARSLAEAQEEIAAWAGPRPRHADLARVVGPSPVERLYVFDSARSAFVAPPKFSPKGWPFGGIAPRIRGRSWLDFWEGPHAMPSMMALYFGGLHRGRVARAVEDVAAFVAERAPDHRADVRRALDNFKRREEMPLEVGYLFRAMAGFESSTDPELRDAKRRAVDADDREAWDAAEYAAERRLAPIVRAHVPLSVVLASAVGAADPDFQRDAFAPTRSAFRRKRNGPAPRRAPPEEFRWRDGGHLWEAQHDPNAVLPDDIGEDTWFFLDGEPIGGAARPTLYKHSGEYGFEDANGYPFASRQEHDRMTEANRERRWNAFHAFQAMAARSFAGQT